jgi:glycosyltransferase involved in cell wall biosynthesis
VLRHSTGPRTDWPAAKRRVIVCCGQMVIAGGLERMTMEVARTLTGHGVAVHCIVNSWENFRITPLAEQVGASWSTGPYWYAMTRRNLTPLKIGRMVWESLRVSGDLLRVARRVKPTHILLPDYQTILRNVPALVLLRALGVRSIARLGNAPDQGRFYRVLWRHVLAPAVDLFVCNSRFGARELMAHDLPPAQVVVVANGPSRRRQPWKGAQGERIPGRVVFVGQLIPDKGLDLLLDAVAMLRTRGLDVTLDVVGDTDGWEAPGNRGYRAAQLARAAQPDLAGAVSFLGWREDVPALMARASLHCCPSRPEQREAFGNVVLEAKLSALPSVVGPSGQLPEFVEHGVDGWACRVATAEAIAEGLAFFLEQPRGLESAGRAALASTAEYTRERFDHAWLEVFDAAERQPEHERIAV